MIIKILSLQSKKKMWLRRDESKIKENVISLSKEMPIEVLMESF